MCPAAPLNSEDVTVAKKKPAGGPPAPAAPAPPDPDNLRRAIDSVWTLPGGWDALSPADRVAALVRWGLCPWPDPLPPRLHRVVVLPARPGPTLARYATIAHPSVTAVLLELSRKLTAALEGRGLLALARAALAALPGPPPAERAPHAVGAAAAAGPGPAADLAAALGALAPGEADCLGEVERAVMRAEVELEFALGGGAPPQMSRPQAALGLPQDRLLAMLEEWKEVSVVEACVHIYGAHTANTLNNLAGVLRRLREHLTAEKPHHRVQRPRGKGVLRLVDLRPAPRR
jgi:hypothetical protein